MQQNQTNSGRLSTLVQKQLQLQQLRALNAHIQEKNELFLQKYKKVFGHALNPIYKIEIKKALQTMEGIVLEYTDDQEQDPVDVLNREIVENNQIIQKMRIFPVLFNSREGEAGKGGA